MRDRQANPDLMLNYQQAIISYVDLLGFQAMVTGKYKKTVGEISEILDNFFLINYDLGDHFSQLNDTLSFSSFSDCIVRARKLISIDDNYRTAMCYMTELYSISLVQNHLVRKDIFIRGGLTFGEIRTEDNKIFGPGMVHAYLLESQYAIYPRILISSEVMQMLSNNPDCIAREVIDDCIDQDFDGRYFIDYLKNIIIVAYQNEEINGDNLKRDLSDHRDALVRFAKQHSDEFKKPTDKIMWLIKYHNRTIRHVLGGRLREELNWKYEELLIEENILPFY